MGIREDLAKSVKFHQCRAWNVNGKFYHSLEGAIDALTDEIDNRIRLRTYYRNRDRYLKIRIQSGFYQPGGFYERWFIRLRQRITRVVLLKYNN